jgi:hypothetical protein
MKGRANPALCGIGIAKAACSGYNTGFRTTVRPKQLFCAAIFADPRSKRAREGMRQRQPAKALSSSAMSKQWNRSIDGRPNSRRIFLVAYAMADTKLSGLILQANGGAFRSNRHWYNIKFKCEAAPDIETIVAFEFSVGEEIPESEWETHFPAHGRRRG